MVLQARVLNVALSNMKFNSASNRVCFGRLLEPVFRATSGTSKYHLGLIPAVFTDTIQESCPYRELVLRATQRVGLGVRSDIRTFLKLCGILWSWRDRYE